MLKSTWRNLKSVGRAAWGVVESPPLVAFKNHGDGVLRYMVSGHGGWVGVGTGDLSGLSNLDILWVGVSWQKAEVMGESQAVECTTLMLTSQKWPMLCPSHKLSVMQDAEVHSV